MEKKYFPLGSSDDNRFVKILRIIFGLACIIMAAYWINFNLSSLRSDRTLWVTIIFLSGFGIYQVFAGAGKTITYIEIGSNEISLKKNPVLPVLHINARDLSKIELFPLSIVFKMSSVKPVILRLGAVHYETNENIIDGIIAFAEENNVPFEIMEEKI